MILVDTNIWIAHFREGEPMLARMLPRRAALIHPYVVGEIALGHLPDRDAVLAELHLIPAAPVAHHAEVRRLIEARNVRGIGYVDAHLVAACLLQPGLRLWTRDKRLLRIIHELSIAADLV